MSDEFKFGKIQVSGTDVSWPSVLCDRIALDGASRLLFASVLADAGIVKGLRAALNSDKRVTITADGIQVKRASGNSFSSRRPDTIVKLDGGYTTLVHRVAHGMAHAFFLSRADGFLPALTDAHLWEAINSTRFTTPLLPEWTPYIRRRLAEKGLLQEAAAWRCECGILKATTADLDSVVSEGIEQGFLAIPSRHAAVVPAVA